MRREGIPDTITNYHKKQTDRNRAGQFYSRAKWPKATVLRSIGDNRSTNKPPSVELLSPIAPPDAPAAHGFKAGDYVHRLAVAWCIMESERLGKGLRFSNPNMPASIPSSSPFSKNPLATDFHLAGDLPCQPSEIFSYPHSWQS